jgi:phosphatidylserine/phosphatidylglycerophosphate/cardiolipin synthase-like enzyme
MSKPTELKNKSRVFLSLLALLFLLGAFYFYNTVKPNHTTTNTAQATTAQPASTTAANFSLITEPDAGITPISNLISGATKSVDLVMYQLEDSKIEAALAADEKRGIKVRVLLNQGYYGAQDTDNETAYNYFKSKAVPVEWTSTRFALTHEKSIVVDQKQAVIMTLNFTPQYYSSSRDFAIVDTQVSDITAMENTFNSDWNNQKLSSQTGADLIWSPGSEQNLINLINSSKKSLEIYNEEMSDQTIITALQAAAKRKVNVEIVMTNSNDWKSAFQALSASGVHIRTYSANASLYIHAKMIVADDATAFLGSENFSTASLIYNRELGLTLTDKNVIASLETTFSKDWKSATPFAN